MPSNHGGRDGIARLARFGCFEADLDSGQLRKRGVKVKLRPQSFQVLLSLIQHPGQVVTRDDLQRQLWPGEVFVNFEKSLNTAVAQLREVLGDSADHPRFIETLPKLGYRFIADTYQPPPAAAESVAARTRLLVLPFVNLSGDPAQEYLSDAMTDEVIMAIASIVPEHLAVIARTTAMRYKGSHKDVARIGRDLNVDYVVEGALRHTADQVAINVQLIQVGDQTHLFARKYDTARRDIFNMPSCVAHAIAAHIPAVASRVRADVSAGTPAAGKSVPDLVAYNEYVQARPYVDKVLTMESLAEAKRHLENAVARDPEFAAAHDALAETYWYLGYFGFLRPRDAFSAGIVHAIRALEIDNTRAETHALLGQFHKTSDYNWGEVGRERALALQLDSGSPIVRVRYAVSDLMPHGRLDEAIAELDRALQSDPLSAYTRSWLSVMLAFAGDYERATSEALRALEISPTNWAAYLAISACERYRGNSWEAIGAQRRCAELSGNAAGMLGWLGLTLAGCGETTEARDILRRLRDMAAKGYVPPTSFAWIHLGLREIDTAFEWLDRAVAECDQFMMPIKSYGFLDPIRSDPRFAALLRKMNLES